MTRPPHSSAGSPFGMCAEARVVRAAVAHMADTINTYSYDVQRGKGTCRLPRPGRRWHPRHLLPRGLQRRDYQRADCRLPVRISARHRHKQPASYPPPPPPDGAGKVSIDGGPDGLRLIRHIVRHATALDSELAITIGSYSSPRAVTTLLRDSGYRIIQLTLGALPLGDHRRGRRRGFSSSTRSSDAR